MNLSWLKNSWMNNVNFLAGMAHGFGALSTILTCWIFWGTTGEIWSAAGLTVAAGIKEFVYDANFEIPKQTFWDNASDFLEYLAGIAVGAGILLLKSHL